MPTKKPQKIDPPAIEKHELSVTAKGVSKINSNLIFLATLKKGEGLGGKVVSLNKPKEKPAP
jgi:hypothetical protein